MDATLYGALVFGVVGTLHCAMMCGPIALLAAAGGAPGSGPEARWRWWRPTLVYHSTRGAAYVALGGVLGGLGGGLTELANLDVRRALPYVLAVALVASAFDVLRYLPAPRPLKGLVQRAWGRVQAATPTARAAIIGSSTALLPCGQLWASVTVAAASGSAVSGMGLMAAFAMGSSPSLVVLQAQGGWLMRKVGPRWMTWIQRGLAVGVAALLILHALKAPPGRGACCHH